MIEAFVREALAEDVGRGDLYALVEPAINASAKIIAKSDGVVAGVKYIDLLAMQEKFEITWLKNDGDTLSFLSAKLKKDFPLIDKLQLKITKPSIMPDCVVSLSNNYNFNS